MIFVASLVCLLIGLALGFSFGQATSQIDYLMGRARRETIRAQVDALENSATIIMPVIEG